MSDDLPMGWVCTNFVEIAENTPNALKAGPFGSALKKSFYVPSGYKIYGQEQVIKEDPFYGDYYIDEEKYNSLRSCSVKPKDILISLVGTIGKVLILPEGISEGIINPRLVKLSLHKSLTLAEFIKAYLESPSVRDYFSKLSHGGTMDILNLTTLKSLPILLPPLNEQRRIVDKLDRIGDRNRTARNELSHIPKLIVRYKQAVLVAAFSGDLTADWRETNQLQHLQIKNWKTTDLGDLIIDSPKNGLYKPRSSYGSGTRILRIDGFYNGEVTSWESLKRLEINEQERTDYALEVNDLVINRVNSPEYVGKSAIVRYLPEPCVFESNIMRFKVNTAQILPEYCVHFLCSPIGLQQLRKNVKHAVNQSSINQTDVKAVRVNVPPLEEQKEIVRRVEKMFEKIDMVEQEYQKAAKLCDRLEQATLAKAFRGELVPQDPDGEPASVLLEQVKSQRSKGKIKTKK
ncbi:restriction endonuclease subunit S [Pseudanabaena sp. BC1403]|uniref:restriction endonuclease subunit S n=1 Tax=Pseudanabaena sp. BC1403 TaxID=2043171 RepID=UPI000CD923F7|nr:restriction endonuclease subunit S [Pseudanabaena sp. BC1403]